MAASETHGGTERAESLVEKAFGLIRAGRFDDALAVAETAWQLDPGRPESLGLLAFIHRELGHSDAAEFCRDRVSAIQPEETDLQADWDYGF